MEAVAAVFLLHTVVPPDNEHLSEVSFRASHDYRFRPRKIRMQERTVNSSTALVCRGIPGETTLIFPLFKLLDLLLYGEDCQVASSKADKPAAAVVWFAGVVTLWE